MNERRGEREPREFCGVGIKKKDALHDFISVDVSTRTGTLQHGGGGTQKSHCL